MNAKKPSVGAKKKSKKVDMFRFILNFKWLAVGLASLIVVFLLVFSLVPLKEVPYTVTETYQAMETVYVKELYTEQEPYTVQEPYTDIEEEYITLAYSVVFEQGYIFFGDGCGAEIYIWNRDQIGGTFKVTFSLLVVGISGYEPPHTITLIDSNYIPAGETSRLFVSYDFGRLVDLNSYSYFITPPTKLVEKEVTKYRTVTKYREVTKERYVPQEVMVSKTRDITLYKKVSLLRYLIEY